MPRYVRLRVPGGTYFFTLRLALPGDTALTDRIGDLRAAYARCRSERPFRTEAVVVLPDHLHAVRIPPEGDADFSTRWKAIKRDFAKGHARPRSDSKHRKGEAGVWQRRFWEHCIKSDAELAGVLHYVWTNPVKHGHVERAVDWPYSSIHRDIRAGRLPPEGV